MYTVANPVRGLLDRKISEQRTSQSYGDRGISIFPVQLTTSKIGNLTRLIHTLLYVMTIQSSNESTRNNPKNDLKKGRKKQVTPANPLKDRKDTNKDVHREPIKKKG